ncbi:MAG: recO [Verrucomicrobiales bacterium]|nr:recO [Verrucomicrobiales bacterium]
MSIERARGIVLRTRPLTDTSLIVQWLTPDLGRIATVAKGARGAKSSFRGQLDLFYTCDFSFVRSKRSDLHTLREAKAIETHPDLRRDIAYVQQASYCAALIEKSTEPETPLTKIYEDFAGQLKELPAHPPKPQTVFAFEMKLLEELGLAPDLTEANLTPGAKQLLKIFTQADWPSIFRVKPSMPQTKELNAFLNGFLIYHLDRIPSGRATATSESYQ